MQPRDSVSYKKLADVQLEFSCSSEIHLEHTIAFSEANRKAVTTDDYETLNAAVIRGCCPKSRPLSRHSALISRGTPLVLGEIHRIGFDRRTET